MNSFHGLFTVVCDGSYDIVLMDLQMPVMSGYDAAKIIREDNRFNDLPIVAMTADAMSGVRETVLDIGMNDYVTKPIDPGVLFRVLSEQIEPSDRELPDYYQVSEKATKEDLPQLDGIDTAKGLERIGGNVKRYKALLIKFVDNQGEAVREITEAISNDEMERAVRLAHTLKGVSGTIGANELHEKVNELEGFLRESKMEKADKALKDVGELLENTIEVLLPLKDVKTDSDTSAEMDSDKLKILMDELKAYLEEDDSKAEDVADGILSIVGGTSLEAPFKGIQEDIAEIEYEDALEKLVKIIEGEH